MKEGTYIRLTAQRRSREAVIRMAVTVLNALQMTISRVISRIVVLYILYVSGKKGCQVGDVVKWAEC